MGVRGLLPPLAGTLQLSFPRFLGLNLTGVSLWAGCFSSLGYLLNTEIQQVLQVLQHSTWVLGLAAILVVLGLAFRRMLRGSQNQCAHANILPFPSDLTSEQTEAKGRETAAPSISPETFLASSGAKAFNAGRLEEALAGFQALLKEHPDDLIILRYIVSGLMSAGSTPLISPSTFGVRGIGGRSSRSTRQASPGASGTASSSLFHINTRLRTPTTLS